MKKKKNPIGKTSKTSRGFGIVHFTDAYGKHCSAQCSSAIDENWNQPGAGFLWLGIDDPEPQILARQAPKLGIEQTQPDGWQPYPIPEEVSINTRMHLNREQVQQLINRLQQWLENGNFS